MHNKRKEGESTEKKSFFKKYFLEGQCLDDSAKQQVLDGADSIERFMIEHRKYIAFLFPVIFMQTLWWLTAIRYDWLSLYETRWHMPLIMILGALVAGMTSEGGGAVAFPFMTLGLHIDPITARDFALLMQSVGMMCALFVIVFMQVQIERRAVLFGTIGSIPGLVVGFKFFDPLLDAAQKKMLFVSIWTSFAIALFILNSQKKRTTYKMIVDFKPWKAAVLIVTGFIGGVFTAFAGSGVDICIFSILTLLFRISEKTATPSTVALMGLNSVVGAYYRLIWEGDVPSLALDYLKVSIPVGVTLAPCGSCVAHLCAGVFIRNWLPAHQTSTFIREVLIKAYLSLPVVIGIAIVVAGFGFFSLISRIGHRLLENDEKNEEMKTVAKVVPQSHGAVHDVMAPSPPIHSPTMRALP